MGSRSTRQPISDEPLINFMHLRLEAILAVAVVLFVLYVTCLPSISASASIDAYSSARWSSQDIVQNIVLYVPFGFFLCLAYRRRHVRRRGRHRPSRRWLAALVTMISALIVSSSAEFTQMFLPGRVSSLIDIGCNVSGALLGVISAFIFRAGTRSFRRGLRDRLAYQPIFMTFALSVIFYVLMFLAPFRLDLTPKADVTLLNPARLAAFTPSRAAEVVPQDRSVRSQYTHAIDLATTLLSFVVIGFLGCWALQEELDFKPIASGFLVLWMLLVLVLALIVARTFLHHHGFEIIFVPLSLTGAFIGILASSTQLTPSRRSPGRLARWAGFAAVITIAVIMARELNPYEFDFTFQAEAMPPEAMPPLREQLAQVGWIPFKQYFATGHTSTVPGDMLAKSGRFFTLGVCLGLALRAFSSWSLAGRIRAGIFIALSVAVGIEVLQWACPGRYPDITHVMLGFAGALCGMIAIQWWLDVIKAYQPQQDDRAATAIQ